MVVLGKVVGLDKVEERSHPSSCSSMVEGLKVAVGMVVESKGAAEIARQPSSSRKLAAALGREVGLGEVEESGRVVAPNRPSSSNSSCRQEASGMDLALVGLVELVEDPGLNQSSSRMLVGC